jgi:hypothetical protein
MVENGDVQSVDIEHAERAAGPVVARVGFEFLASLCRHTPMV